MVKHLVILSGMNVVNEVEESLPNLRSFGFGYTLTQDDIFNLKLSGAV